MRSGALSDAQSLDLRFLAFYLGVALILAGRGSRPSRIAVMRSTIGATTRVSQQVVFYLPVFVGAGLIAVDALRFQDWRLEAFALLVILGVVRESGAIPSFGDAYLDLLGAFVPFTLAALCLCLIAWSRE